MKSSALAFIAAVALLVGCRSVAVPPKRESDTTCPKHHTELFTKEVYRITPSIMADPSQEYNEKADRYPWHTPWYFAEKQSGIYTVRETIRYCPQCDVELGRALR